ncbi:lymphocyte antigen-6, epidermis [Synchiropus splendidus]|uniref:lymphocyte antigen-6, epidermis n=1 Tax=Synchiropus splendidus TaxID=270530 RepID=UPI00237D8B60|nr:lymphocyte antigen-6, epidermis [Synchiropus splendidus]
MDHFLKAVVVLVALVAAAESLKCRECIIELLSLCPFGTDVTCNNGTNSCSRGEAQFNATGSLKLHNRGCVDNDLCGKTISGSILGAGYTSSFTCCTTDLCNSATTTQMSIVLGLCAAAMSTLMSL